ncbi:MAG: hypothetical protein RL417_999 [Pseudomonadota bacterium]|jgi:hypothetical protein
MIHFNGARQISVCVEGDHHETLAGDIPLVIDSLPVPVHVRAFRTKVVVTMRSQGIILHTTFGIDRRNRTVSSEGCLAPSLKEWSLHFQDFLGGAV